MKPRWFSRLNLLLEISVSDTLIAYLKNLIYFAKLETQLKAFENTICNSDLTTKIQNVFLLF